MGVPVDLIPVLLQGLAEGQYHLLCGAGVSIGARGGDGGELQVAAKVAKEILDRTSTIVDPAEEGNLAIVYEEAKVQDRTKLNEYLRKRFTQCSPTWQAKLFDIRWHRIWTLNIDDVLERVFDGESNKAKFRKISPISWRDKFSPPEKSASEVQVIHLHGLAERVGGDGEDLIFGLVEYSNVVRTVPPWHAAFETAYVQDPFIICGARLAEEPDFAIATRTKNQSRIATGFPSVIVLKEVSPALKIRLERFGLIPVEATGDAFFSALLEDIGKYKNSLEKNAVKNGVFERFSIQFRRLDPRADLIDLGTDFYGGDEPTWLDIVNGKDVIFKVTGNVIRDIEKQRGSCVYVLHGTLATGKTAACLRIAKDIVQYGYTSYFFRNEESIDVDACLGFLSAAPKTALIFDDAADHSAGIGKLATRCAEAGIQCVIIAAERPRRLRALKIDVPDKYRREYLYSRLDDSDLWGLIAHRRKVARLGSLVRKSDRQVFDFFRDACHRELFESLSQAEYSKGFKARISDYIDAELRDAATKNVSTVVACVHRFGHLLPIATAMRAAGAHFDRFKALLEDALGSDGIIVRERKGLRLRHRVISEELWKFQTVGQKYDAMLLVCQHLAPAINPKTIKAKLLPHRIVREILDVEEVVNSLQLRAFEFYAELEPIYGWSSRFWDQRALLESKAGNFQKAYSYSQKAVSLERHAFAYNTLGYICLVQANHMAESNSQESKEIYTEGVAALDDARVAAERNDLSFEHPYVTFFSNTLRYAQHFGQDDVSFSLVESHWDRWIKAAHDASCFKTHYGQRRIRELMASWLKVKLARGKDSSTK
ncbi:SIR2 family protein [Burkholderia semiarida]|uniref:P-loop NTPase n=1 Tax=Burkholderia semiarida TaxID=2843303 RepID=UPI003878273A